MKTIFRYLCGWMALMSVAACTNDDFQEVVDMQKPTQGKVISVKAYTPSEQTATRLDFEDKGEEGLKLSWTVDDTFTAIINNEKVTFTYGTESNEFKAALPDGVETISNGTVACYPAYYGESFELDLSSQTGALNSATTYMQGEYTNGAFSFKHLTAILKTKFTFPESVENTEIRSIAISGAATINIMSDDIKEDAVYINLPDIEQGSKMEFVVTTNDNILYTATKMVREGAKIEIGTFYNTTVELTKAICELPKGSEFKSALSVFLGGKSLTKIKFIANSNNTNKDNQIGTSDAYMVEGSDNTLEIHTAAAEFVFNEDCNNMFSQLSAITSIDFGDCVTTSNVTDMGFMFAGCTSLTSLDLRCFNTANVTAMNHMFYASYALANLDLSTFNTSNVTNMMCMFTDCSSLTSLDLVNFDTSSVSNMMLMFSYCSNLTFLNVSNFDTSGVTNISDMFAGCSSLTSIDLSNFDTSSVTDMFSMFNSCSNLTSLDVSSFNTDNVTDMGRMFLGCSNLTSLDLSSFNTSNVTEMNQMFEDCSLLQSITFGDGFNTSNVQYMNGMFQSCTSFTSLDLSSFNTEKVIQMSYMFKGCTSLTSLNVSGFNTSSVVDMSYMFQGCSKLTTLDLHSFNTEKVENMSYMFNSCKSFTSLDLSNFNTEKLMDMNYMFSDCSKLTSLDLSSFDFYMVYYMDGIFYQLGLYAGDKSIVYVKDEISKFLLDSRSTDICLDSNYAEIQVKTS